MSSSLHVAQNEYAVRQAPASMTMGWMHSVPVAKLGLDVPCVGPMHKESDQGCKKEAPYAWEEDSSSVDPAVQEKVDGGLHAAHTFSQEPAASLSTGI